MKPDDDQPARPTLDYPSPPPSPYDRPVEDTLRFARQLQVVVGVMILFGVVVAIGFIVWVVRMLT